MSWAKIDDLLPHHRKLVAVGLRAPMVYGYYVASINFCRRHYTDGQIRGADLPLIFPSYPKPGKWLLAELVRIGFWEDKPDGSWAIHDFLEHNDTAAEIKAKLRADSIRKRAGMTADSNRNQMGIRNISRRRSDKHRSDQISKDKQSSVPPAWAASLPWPSIPPRWWAQMFRLFPELDHEAICRNAAAYWLEHPRKYRSAPKFLRNQFARAFAARAPDPYVNMTSAWDCATCGEVHEAGRDAGPTTCPHGVKTARPSAP